MKISEMITDRYKLRIPPTVYYELLADVQEAEEEQELTTKNNLGVDCISRADLIERINNAEEQFKYDNMETIGSDDGDPFVDGVLSGVWNIREMVKQAPSVTPQPCEDAVSRQAVLDIAKASKSNWIDNSILFKRVNEIPSVTPQEPRKGHWILDEADNSITCDKCGCLIWANDISNGEAYYCPNCGADMREVEE